MASLVNRDYADKRFLQAVPQSFVRAAEGARARFGRALVFGALALFGLAMASASGTHPLGGVADPGVRIDRG